MTVGLLALAVLAGMERMMVRSLLYGLLFVLWTAIAMAGDGADGRTGQAEKEVSVQKAHRHFSASCFNQCWTLIDKSDRSAEDVEDMVLAAYASLWHWKQRDDCEPVNLSIGYWQVSRVHALAGHYEMARLFGEKCLKVGKENHLAPFYVGYAYEALARAELLHRDAKTAEGHLAKARRQLDKVADKEERALLLADIVGLEAAAAKGPE